MLLTKNEKAKVKRIFRQKDFNRFAEISKDDNVTHVDPEFAATTRFGRTLAHGMHLYSYINRILGTQLPGPGMIQISQEFMFPSGIYVGDEAQFEVEVLNIDEKNNTAEFATRCYSPRELAVDGTSKVILPSSEKIVFPGVREDIAKYDVSEGDRLANMTLGQEAKLVRTFTQQDLEDYAFFTGDQNPLYIDEDFAQKKGLKGCIVPGPMLSSMFSMLLGTKLPGKGTNWLKQKIHFPNPAYIGEEITATIKIVRIRPDKKLVNFYDECVTRDGKIVCQAESLVLALEMV